MRHNNTDHEKQTFFILENFDILLWNNRFQHHNSTGQKSYRNGQKQTQTNSGTRPAPTLYHQMWTDAFEPTRLLFDWRQELPPERWNKNLWIERARRKIFQRVWAKRAECLNHARTGYTEGTLQLVRKNNIISGMEPKNHTWKHEVRFAKHNHVSNWFYRHILRFC